MTQASSIISGATGRAVLIVLDGFGIGKDSPFNAISNAEMPFFKALLKNYPHSELLTHGAAVGLPDGVMGNSEVGHMTMGSGRIIYQDLSRISKAIADGEFFKNPVLTEALKKSSTGRVHLFTLLSDGGVHSHITHLEAALDLCVQQQVPNVYVHAFLDGRDTPPDSAPTYIQQLETHPVLAPQGQGKTLGTLASVSGRYYGMDRDNRWERVSRAYDVLTGQAQPAGKTALEVVQASYAAGKTDEFIEPTLLDADGAIRDGDTIVFLNFRADRARELTQAFMNPAFSAFARKAAPKPAAYATLTTYDRSFAAWGVQVAYGPQNLDNIFGSCLEARAKKQFRIAETEKYAHVTFFFNGGREEPFAGEDRLLIPSPKDVATYDLKPEMSAPEVAAQAAAQLDARAYDFMLMNFANADMVGHTGNYSAAVQAMVALDRCLAQVVGSAQKAGYHTLITADHGNAEEMQDHQGRPHTQHTLNPVPAIWVAPNTAIAPRSARKRMQDGGLSDIMPTLCALMGLPIPAEVTGKSLLPPSESNG